LFIISNWVYKGPNDTDEYTSSEAQELQPPIMCISSRSPAAVPLPRACLAWTCCWGWSL